MAAKRLILCDTNIVFKLFHNDRQMAEELDELGFNRLLISAITIGETYYGMRKGEVRQTKELLRKFGVVHLSMEVSSKFIELMANQERPKLQIPDAIIASSAIAANAQLFTLNRKDFDSIKGLELYNPSRKLN